MTTRRLKTPPAPAAVLAVVPVVPVVPSLPPAPADGSLSASLPAIPRKSYAMPKNAVIRKKALAIVALRAAGWTSEQIAAELGLKRESLHTYVWRASRAGYLVNPKTKETLLVDPIERVEELTHKVLDNFNEMLTSEQILERGQKSVKMEATFELARGALFKKFDQTVEGVQQTFNGLKIEIVMPSSGMNEARPGAMGGVPQTYIDVEPVK